MELDNIIRILIPMSIFDYDALISQFDLENSILLSFWVSESHNFMYIGHLIDLRLYLKKLLKKILQLFHTKSYYGKCPVNNFTVFLSFKSRQWYF